MKHSLCFVLGAAVVSAAACSNSNGAGPECPQNDPDCFSGRLSDSADDGDDGDGNGFGRGGQDVLGTGDTDRDGDDGDEADAGGGFSDGTECVDVDVAFRPVIPNVVLLVDRSGSMNASFEGADNRWEAVKQALIDPTDGVVATLQDQVRFGLLLYSSNNGFEGGTCPDLIGEEVPLALDNFDAIRQVYEPADYLTNGDTPTAEAVVAARQLLDVPDLSGPRHIVLATDGEPDTCEDHDAHNGQTNARSVRTVEETFGSGVELSVLAVGDDVGADHLQDLANAGAGKPDAVAYAPADKADLVDAFRAIVDQARTCEVDLDHSITESQAAQGRVELDGTALEYQGENGWRLSSDTRIQLLGTACERIKEDAHALSIAFPCGTVVPI